LRIRAELRERGIAEGLTARLLDESDEAWTQALREAHDRKFGPGRPPDLRELARRVRFLEYRGFSGERVRRFLRFDD
jgi:regulatory protein